MLQVNFIFLVMIIIVLVTKLRANNAVETVQVRKAIKATFILVPLLGISNLLFVANPADNGFGEKVLHHYTGTVDFVLENVTKKKTLEVFERHSRSDPNSIPRFQAYIVVNLILKGSQVGSTKSEFYCGIPQVHTFAHFIMIMCFVQGIFVALIYCFLNTEVQIAIQKKFYRAALRRNPETQSFRFGSIHGADMAALAERRKSSTRTGSTTLVSSTEVLRALFRSRRGSSRTSHHGGRQRNVSLCNVQVTPPLLATDYVIESELPTRPRGRVNSSVTFAPVLVTKHDSLSDEEPLTVTPSSSDVRKSHVIESRDRLTESNSSPHKSVLSNGHSHQQYSTSGSGRTTSIESPVENEPLISYKNPATSSDRFAGYTANVSLNRRRPRQRAASAFCL